MSAAPERDRGGTPDANPPHGHAVRYGPTAAFRTGCPALARAFVPIRPLPTTRSGPKDLAGRASVTAVHARGAEAAHRQVGERLPGPGGGGRAGPGEGDRGALRGDHDDPLDEPAVERPLQLRRGVPEPGVAGTG